MSCASSNLSNQDPNYYQTVNGYAVPSSIPYDRNTPNGCRKYKGGYPPFAPTVGSLSVTSSGAGTYSLVYITGTNFLPPCYGNTYVNFGQFKQLPITFYSTSSISFVVPLGALAGIYKVVVVNIYNSNFSPAVNQTYSGNPNFSNPLAYQVFGYTISNGAYTITSNAQYNTIITFSANTSITFYQKYTINYIVVGGGGGGGSGQISTGHGTSSGGGGGGGITFGTTVSYNNKYNNILTYNILIGSGGLAGSKNGLNGDNGNPSYINIGSNNISTANGGFGGQTGQVTNVSGSGGASGTTGTSGVPRSIGGEGGFFNGGPGDRNPTIGTLGGGGGGETFGVGTGANGSLNISVPIYGTAFGAGGGGGSFNSLVGNGGNSNAGNGSGFNSGIGGKPNAGNGKPNTGGGGGGGGYVNTLPSIGNGGNGGSGVIIFYFNA